jgi:fatty acid desaturase
MGSQIIIEQVDSRNNNVAPQNQSAVDARVPWYRCRVSREELQELNRRSDWKGFLQTGGFLGILVVTGYAAYFAIGRLAWPWVVLLFFFHGMCWQFLINGFHELIHDSVFKTKRLNKFFLYVFGFLSWWSPYQFWASHTEHHKYTLHPPRDLEVVLPIQHSIIGYLRAAFVDPVWFWRALSSNVKIAFGKVEGPWDNALFPESKPEARRKLFRWARILLAGQVAIVAVSIVMRWWWLPLEITLAPFYGGWLFYLCNSSQHVGMQDNVPDFRLCCRTIQLNPLLRFLYWHMNYHTEHHMYAAVPCYNLRKLHTLVRADMPECPKGLLQTWRQIGAIMERQKIDPSYQFTPQFPSSASARVVSLE